MAKKKADKKLTPEEFRRLRGERRTAEKAKSTMTAAERAALARQKKAGWNRSRARRKTMGRG